MPRKKSNIPKVTICTRIPIGDYNWCRENSLQFNTLLESAIAIHRNALNDGIKEDYFNYLKSRVNALQKRLNDLNNFINTKGIYDEFNKFQEEEIKKEIVI